MPNSYPPNGLKILKLALFVFGDGIQWRVDHYKRYLTERSELRWKSVGKMETSFQKLIHIHGKFSSQKYKIPFIKLMVSAIILTKSGGLTKSA